MHAVTDAVRFSPWEPGLLILSLYTFLVLALVGVLLFLAGWLGERKAHPDKSMAYESGVIPTGAPHLRNPVPFFLVAMFFLIFDVEAAAVFCWAIAFERLGWSGWLQITFFIVILLFGWAYVWKKGGLDWRSRTS